LTPGIVIRRVDTTIQHKMQWTVSKELLTNNKSPGTAWALFILRRTIMTTEKVLLIICILIEVYHVCLHDYIQTISKPILERHKWADAYKNMTESVMTLSESISKNPDLNKHLDINILLLMLKGISAIGGPTRFRDSVFKEIPPKQLGMFILLQLVELIYWVISFILACILPHGTGFIMFLTLMLLSWIQSKNNKAKNPIKYWYLADSLICNTMFIALCCM